VVPLHEAVPSDLGDDAGGGDAQALAVAFHDGLAAGRVKALHTHTHTWKEGGQGQEAGRRQAGFVGWGGLGGGPGGGRAM
jgi:hypothetical protein